jgi:6-pyruvoyl-tetrahydropterin synthase
MTKQTEFTTVITLESAHSVLEQRGRHEKLHGHSWTITARWAMDFPLDPKFFERHLSYLQKSVSDLNHENLNNIKEVKETVTTAESIARLIFDRLSKINAKSRPISVQVEEEPDCSISYFGSVKNK